MNTPCNEAVISVRGRLFHSNWNMPLGWQQGWPLVPASQDAPRCAMCHVRAGSAMFVLEGQMLLISAPAVLILDERMRPEIQQPHGLELETLYFHPSLVNQAYKLPILRAPAFEEQHLEGAAKQDYYLIGPFLHAPLAERVLKISPAASSDLQANWNGAITQAQLQLDQFWTCRSRSYLITLLFQLRMLEADLSILRFSAHESLTAETTRISRALQYVQQHFQHDFTLDDVARHCGTNRTTLNAEFRRATGQTVRAYTIGLRMEMVSAWLRDTLLPISEIMARVGYENQSHFTRAFKQLTGLSPAAYREKHCWMIKRSAPVAS